MSNYNKTLDYKDIYLLGLGHIIGAGIYSLIANVNSSSVSGSFGPIAVLLCGLVIRHIGKKYYKVVEDSPITNGSETLAVEKKFGKLTGETRTILSSIGAILTMIVVSGTFGEYLHYLIPSIDSTTGSILCALLSSTSSILGTKKQLQFNNLITITEISGLLIVILTAIQYAINKPDKAIEHLQRGFGESQLTLNSILYGAGIILFAYFGFESIPKIKEEAKNPKDVPKALINSIDTSIVLYVLVSISLLTVYSPKRLVGMKSPLSRLVDKSSGFGKVFSLIPLASTFNTFLIILMATSRLLKFYLDRKKSKQIKDIAKLDKKSKTPVKLEVIITLLVIGALLTKYKNIKVVLISNILIITSIMLVYFSK